MFDSITGLAGKLAGTGYFIDPVMTQVVFLAAKLQKPLLLEGPAGSGNNGTCCRSKVAKTNSPRRSSTARSPSTTCSAWLSSLACCSPSSNRPTLSPPRNTHDNQSQPNSRRSRHASVRKPYSLNQPRDRQGPIVRLVRARPKPPPHFGKPNTGRQRERGRIREGCCGPKERHAVASATGMGGQTRGMSVCCSPLSGDLTEFRSRDTTA